MGGFQLCKFIIRTFAESQDSSVGEYQICDQKVLGLIPGWSSGIIFFSRVCLVFVPPSCYLSSRWKTLVILPRVYVAGYSWTYVIVLASEVRVGWLCCPGRLWEPTRKMTSHATCQGTVVHSHLSLLSHYGLCTDAGLKSRTIACKIIST